METDIKEIIMKTILTQAANEQTTTVIGDTKAHILYANKTYTVTLERDGQPYAWRSTKYSYTICDFVANNVNVK